MYIYSRGGHFCLADCFNTKLLSAVIVFLTLETIGFTLRKREAQFKGKMIKTGFFKPISFSFWKHYSVVIKL